MAKGFTVKANAHKKKEAEWDIAAIKERMRGKTIVFCLPGRGCSYTFLKNFVQLCFDMVQSGLSIKISQDYSSMVNFARCKVLGANVLRGPNQVPWDGRLEYDYQLWIDNDIVFNTEKFWQLCDMALPAEGEEKEIVAGWYATEDGHTTSVAHWLEEDDFRKNGGVMNHENVESISKRRTPFTVDYTGFGWVLIKKGVFENLEYPCLLLRCSNLSLAMFRTCAVRMSHSVLMLKNQVMKSGAILGFVLVTKKLALSNKEVLLWQ